MFVLLIVLFLYKVSGMQGQFVWCVCIFFCFFFGGVLQHKIKKIFSSKPDKIYFSVTEPQYQFAIIKTILDVLAFAKTIHNIS